MKTFKLSLIIFTVVGMVTFFSSCKKDNEGVNDNDTNYSQDDSFAEGVFDNVSNISDEAYYLGINNLKSGSATTTIIGPCATISLDTNVYPRELIIDFGEVNCLCNDGRYRRGKIIVAFTGRYRHEGTVITTTFDEYHVNDNKIEGTKVVTNMGPNEDGHPYFTVNITGVIYRALGGTLSWNAQKVRTWIQGYNTWPVFDDIYEITGEADGIRPNGKTWEREIVNPLRKEVSCRWIVSGTVEIRPEDRPVRVLDYGAGNCDNIATVLINGVTYTIFLR
jgi:hypothetical protein